MKKVLLLFAMALTTCFSVEAQDETSTPVHKRVLLAAIEDAKTIVADRHYTSGQSTLQAAITQAESKGETVADDVEVRDAVLELQEAIDNYVFTNGYVDATDRIQNPSFDKDANNATSITSWTNTGFKQNRRSVSYTSTRKNDEGVPYSMTNFVEQWANATSLSGKGDINQTISGLPAGHYRLAADFIIVSQKTADIEEASGAQFYANDKVVELGLTATESLTDAAAYSIDIDLAEGETLTIGFRFAELNLNWLGWDNVTLTFIGDPDDYNSIVNAEKVAAALEALNASINATKEALADENKPLGRTALQEALEIATPFTESNILEDIEQAKASLDEALKVFNNYNRYYINLKKAIADAEALIASGEMPNGIAEFQEIIEDAKGDMTVAVTEYAESPEEAIILLEMGLDKLKKGESNYRIANASYAHPANVITNGSMSSTAGWEILAEGANPDLHINTSGTVTNFSKPFMECWVNNTDYGKENYAKQTVTALPDGQPLPKGYYVLKAAALATRQDQPSLQVSGVTLKFEDQVAEVHTANGVAEIYQLGYEKTEEGGELTIGLYIDAETNANWIAWDEVELQFVGDKEKYLEEYTTAVLGESMEKLKAAVADARALLESVDPNGVDITDTDLYNVVDDAQYIIDNPTDKDATKEHIEELLEEIAAAKADFYTCGVSPKEGNWFDFTSFIKNAEFDTNPTAEEWEVVTGILPAGPDCVYWWFGSSGPEDMTQEFNQTISGIPAGNYLLDVQAAIRVGMNYRIDEYKEENLPNYLTSCKIYVNTNESSDSVDVLPFFYEDETKGLTLESMLAMTNDYDYRHGNGTLIDYMLKQTDLYHNYVPFTLTEGGDITIGFLVEVPSKNGSMPFIDYFHLMYFGNQDPGVYTGISEAYAVQPTRSTGIYTLSGQRVSKPTKGLYIKNGRKFVIK